MAETSKKRYITAQYMGSFPVAGFDVACRAKYLRAKLDLLRYNDRSTSVLLIVSLAGIKVCSPDGKRVQMAHALRRISYATCEPCNGQFSFLAREPRAHFSIQYCHSFITESPQQRSVSSQCLGLATLTECASAVTGAASASAARATSVPESFAGYVTDSITSSPNNSSCNRAARQLQYKQKQQQNRGMRRFARRRRTLAAFTAIMGRLGRAAAGNSNSSQGGSLARPIFKVHYRKLVEDQSPAKKPRSNEHTPEHHHQQHHQQQLKFIPPLPDYMSYCCCRCGHTQKLKAEELNTIVGNAFRMAYVAQLQRQPMLQDVINSKSNTNFRKDKHQQRENRAATWNQTLIGGDSANNNIVVGKSNNKNNDSTSFWQLTSVDQLEEEEEEEHQTTSPTNSIDSSANADSSTVDMNLQLGSAGSPTLRLSSVKTPNSIPGLRAAHNFGNALSSLHGNDDGCATTKSVSQQSTPSSDESNSPTELNSYKRLADKPPLIKRLAMGLTGGRDVLGLNGEDDSCPLVSGGSTPTSPTTTRPHSGGYINEAIVDSDNTSSTTTTTTKMTRPPGQNHHHHHHHYGKLLPVTENLDNTINSSINTKDFNIENNRLVGQNSLSAAPETDFKSKRRSQISTSSSSAGVTADGSTHGSTPTPPPLPERTDSLNNRSEESELRRAPWFQAGIPREITLEVLSQEPEGAFMVRESTSKPGCYALSLRVPREFQPSGIAHYLIMRTNKGYKIKGFTKEFTTLTALITHHSVMPELLPCPLSLSRYNPSFVKTDSSKDFADIDSDPDYNTLADFRKMMADLNV